MNIYIAKNNARNGPFTNEQVVEMVRKGDVLMSDLAWSEGMAEWKPIHSITQIAEDALPPLPASGKELPSNLVGQSSPALVTVPPNNKSYTKPYSSGVSSSFKEGIGTIIGIIIWLLVIVAACVFCKPDFSGYGMELWLSRWLFASFFLLGGLILCGFLLLIARFAGQKESMVSKTLLRLSVIGLACLMLEFLGGAVILLPMNSFGTLRTLQFLSGFLIAYGVIKAIEFYQRRK